MQLLRIHYQKLFVCVSFIMVIVVVVHVWEAGEEGEVLPQQHQNHNAPDNDINIDEPLLRSKAQIGNEGNPGGGSVFLDLFHELTKEEHCPLCFGTDLCEDISAGFLTLSSDAPRTEDRAKLFDAQLADLHKLTVKVPSSDRFAQLDKLVCKNASMAASCSPGVAAAQTFLAKTNVLTTRGMFRLLRALDITRPHYPLLMCPSKKLLAVIEKTFDENDDHMMSVDEKLAMYTTLTVAPEFVILKLLTKANLNVGFPRLVGVCGRVGVLEGELTPMASLLEEPFNVRASLAAQILTMVDDFMEDDPEWYLFYGSWSLEKMAVNKEGEAVLTDLADMAIVDKAYFRDDYDDGTESRKQSVCNTECFQRFTQEIYREDNSMDESCARVEEVGHLMYASVCAMILSDMKQHKYVDLFNSPSGARQHPRTTQGLLHNIPSGDRSTVEELLAECVEEASPGGRLQAAQELRDYLSDFLLEEEEDDEDDDDDDEDDYTDDDYEDDDEDDDEEYDDYNET